MDICKSVEKIQAVVKFSVFSFKLVGLLNILSIIFVFGKIYILGKG